MTTAATPLPCLTLFPSATQTAGTLVEVSSIDFDNPIVTTDKTQGVPLLHGGRWPDCNRRGDGPGPSEHHWLIFDLDSALDSDSMDVLLDLLGDSGLTYIAHTSWSYGSVEKPGERWRILLPLSEPVPSASYESAVRNAAATFGIPDAALGDSVKPRLCMFAPAVHPDRVDEYSAERGEGELLRPEFAPPSVNAVDTSAPKDGLDALAARRTEWAPIASKEVWIASTLAAYPPYELDQGGWQDVLAAIAYETGGTESGFELFWAWSSGTLHNRPNLSHKGTDKDDVRKRFRSFAEPRDGELPLTLRSIMKRPSDVAGVMVRERAEERVAATATSHVDLERFVSYARSRPKRSRAATDLLATTLFEKAHAIAPLEAPQNYPSVADVIVRLETNSPALVEQLADPAFFRKNVVRDETQPRNNFLMAGAPDAVGLDTLDGAYRGALRAIHGPKAQVREALKGAYGYLPVDTCSRHYYSPAEGETHRVAHMSGPVRVIHINDYRQGSIPPVADPPFDPQPGSTDEEMRRLVDIHMNILSNGEARIGGSIVRWIAHMRQRPLEKMRWGLGILSELSGIGKSSVTDLCRIAVGDENTIGVAKDKADGSFDDWLIHPSILIAFEEFGDSGKRDKATASAVASLKEMMTSDSPQIMNVKGKSMVPMAVMSRFIITANQLDLISSPGLRRRWLVTVVDERPPHQLDDIFGPLRKEDDSLSDVSRRWYNEVYWPFIRANSDRFIAYLDSIDLSGFDPSDAPARAKATQSSGEADEEAKLIQRVIVSLIEDETVPNVSDDVIPLVLLRREFDRVSATARLHGDDALSDTIAKYGSETGGRAKSVSKILPNALVGLGWGRLSDYDERETVSLDAIEGLVDTVVSVAKTTSIWVRLDQRGNVRANAKRRVGLRKRARHA